ncbi:hypothetical protein HYC85_031635 [Camellia sinensis]|uniref:NAD-dependent epimerase/dehydratase domain-containing protein n=1 Tax=Camellia sinensis TaxID=4442 RepID=A0A7J7FR71_CAMSI|nr:hypothetical protein HYC85_031635 [Camellia sinensis]
MERKEVEVVCVTGASGFIGSELVRQLLLRGYVVHATKPEGRGEGEEGGRRREEAARSPLQLVASPPTVAAIRSSPDPARRSSCTAVASASGPASTSSSSSGYGPLQSGPSLPPPPSLFLSFLPLFLCDVRTFSDLLQWSQICSDRHRREEIGLRQVTENEQETKHLEALEGAKTRLRLFQMDLLDYTSIFASINGISGVFHVASPCVLQVHDPQKQLLEPAIEGTKNVLKAAKELGARRVVLTSSFSTIIPNYNWPADVVLNEDSWSDVDYCRREGLWYSVSKNLAEKAAWEFAKEKDLNMVVVIPGAVFGPILPPTINSSMSVLLRLLQENDFSICFHYSVDN